MKATKEKIEINNRYSLIKRKMISKKKLIKKYKDRKYLTYI